MPSPARGRPDTGDPQRRGQRAAVPPLNFPSKPSGSRQARRVRASPFEEPPWVAGFAAKICCGHLPAPPGLFPAPPPAKKFQFPLLPPPNKAALAKTISMNMFKAGASVPAPFPAGTSIPPFSRRHYGQEFLAGRPGSGFSGPAVRLLLPPLPRQCPGRGPLLGNRARRGRSRAAAGRGRRTRGLYLENRAQRVGRPRPPPAAGGWLFGRRRPGGSAGSAPFAGRRRGGPGAGAGAGGDHTAHFPGNRLPLQSVPGGHDPALFGRDAHPRRREGAGPPRQHGAPAAVLCKECGEKRGGKRNGKQRRHDEQAFIPATGGL